MLDDFTRAERRRYLGSSDAAAICLQDPWGRTPGDVWAEKTGRVSLHITGNTAIELGNYLEPAILQWIEDKLGVPLRRDVFLISPRNIRCANLDALATLTPEPAIVEAKTAGLIGRPQYIKEFGEAGTDEIPTHVLIQIHHQLGVAHEQPDLPPIDLVYVPAILLGRGFVRYHVREDRDLTEAIIEEEERFWRDHVVTDKPPPETPSLRTLRAMQRTAEIAATIDRRLVDLWLSAREVLGGAKALEDAALRDVLTALGDAEEAKTDGGVFTFKQQTRKQYVVQASTYRVPRFRADKEEKK